MFRSRFRLWSVTHRPGFTPSHCRAGIGTGNGTLLEIAGRQERYPALESGFVDVQIDVDDLPRYPQDTPVLAKGNEADRASVSDP